jgi:hypothetical protein
MPSGTFALDVSRWVAKANGNTDLVLRKITLDLTRSVVMKTPVDTGRARGAWSVSIATIPPYEVKPEDKSGGNVLSKAAGTINSEVKAGQVIYLTNTLPYILRLEEGYSKQAPAGMVGLTLREWPGIVRTSTAGLP